LGKPNLKVFPDKLGREVGVDLLPLEDGGVCSKLEISSTTGKLGTNCCWKNLLYYLQIVSENVNF
jgi:hypothetical protein